MVDELVELDKRSPLSIASSNPAVEQENLKTEEMEWLKCYSGIGFAVTLLKGVALTSNYKFFAATFLNPRT